MLELTTETRVDLARSGARQGLGLFETIRIQRGEPRWMELHLERLALGCVFLGLEPPPDAVAVREYVIAHTSCAALELGVLRLLAVDDALHVFAEPLRLPNPQTASLGRSLETIRFSGNPLNRFKTLSYLENLRLTQEATERDLFEVIALNEKGHLTDGGRTSLFIVRGGRVFSPPTLDGALPGVARRVLLEAGVATEATLVWADLEGAEAVFLANALRGVMPVDRLEGAGVLDVTHPAVRWAAESLA
jgi:branched-chain amino acid aminotransferase